MTAQRPLPSEKQVATVYRQLADEYSDERSRGSVDRAWQRIELKQKLSRRKVSWAASRMGTPRLVGYGVAAMAFALCVILLWPGGGDLRYTLEGGTLKDGWVVTQGEPAALSFSDGSRVAIDQETSLSINVLGERSALTRVGRGSLHVAVQHHDDTRWTFLAGPYEVRVEGTEFDLSWSDEQLKLTMHEGRVRVVGPDQQEWILNRGDTLVTPREEAPHVAEAPLPPADAQQDAEKDENSVESIEHTGVQATHKQHAWNELLVDGRFDQIVSTAERAGIERTLAARSISDLVALGQAARYVGKAGLAEDCWKTIRARAPGSSNATQGAFFLGRIMEQQGRVNDAIRWFERYREEAPSGVYAGQALGRQLALTAGQGKASKARNLAKEYLERFGNGPYANAARAALEDASTSSPEQP